MFKQAPLPFMGQKRSFRKEFIQALQHFDERATYVDLFGGSGLLSHIIKQTYPKSTVIYNDFDNYCDRLANIPITNQLFAELRPILQDSPEKGKRLPEAQRTQVLQIIGKYDQQFPGKVDYLTLSASLLFPQKYMHNLAGFSIVGLYNRLVQKNYQAKGYLQGLTITRQDYQALFEQYKDQDNVVFVLDPPYLSTNQQGYKKDRHWKLLNYLEVLQVLKGQPYIFFTSEKSELLPLIQFLNDQGLQFINSDQMKVYTRKMGWYEDVMLVSW